VQRVLLRVFIPQVLDENGRSCHHTIWVLLVVYKSTHHDVLSETLQFMSDPQNDSEYEDGPVLAPMAGDALPLHAPIEEPLPMLPVGTAFDLLLGDPNEDGLLIGMMLAQINLDDLGVPNAIQAGIIDVVDDNLLNVPTVNPPAPANDFPHPRVHGG